MQKTMWKVSWMHDQNCGACTNCKDMKRFGGPGTKKKACIRRCCWSDTATGMYSRATRLPYMAHTMSTGMPAQARKPNTIHCIPETKSLISCNLPKYFVHRLPPLHPSPPPTTTSLHLFLANTSRKTHSIKGDGNCLFRSLSHQRLNTEYLFM